MTPTLRRHLVLLAVVSLLVQAAYVVGYILGIARMAGGCP